MSLRLLVRDMFAPSSASIMNSMQRSFLVDFVIRTWIVSGVDRVDKVSSRFICDFENEIMFSISFYG